NCMVNRTRDIWIRQSSLLLQWTVRWVPARSAVTLVTLAVVLCSVVSGAEPATDTARSAGVSAIPAAPVRASNATNEAIDSNSAVEKQYEKLLAEDTAAQAEVAKWTRTNQEARTNNAAAADELN